MSQVNQKALKKSLVADNIEPYGRRRPVIGSTTDVRPSLLRLMGFNLDSSKTIDYLTLNVKSRK